MKIQNSDKRGCFKATVEPLQIEKKVFFTLFKNIKNINNDECIEFVSNWWGQLKLKIIIEMKNLSSFFYICNILLEINISIGINTKSLVIHDILRYLDRLLRAIKKREYVV